MTNKMSPDAVKVRDELAKNYSFDLDQPYQDHAYDDYVEGFDAAYEFAKQESAEREQINLDMKQELNRRREELQKEVYKLQDREKIAVEVLKLIASNTASTYWYEVAKEALSKLGVKHE